MTYPGKTLMSRFCVLAALLMALTWPAHVAAADRSVADLNCQVSALASASELNVDCGGILPECPVSFRLVEQALPVSAYVCVPEASFLGRAPPLL
ncbi:MAG: hypothetical protein AB7V08_08250 [Elusimicrobiales bacterium]